MARSGIYKSEVVRARNKLLASGQVPTIDAIRLELGNTGSKTTIQRYVKEIEEEAGGNTGTKVSVSEAIQDLADRLARQLQDEAEVRVTEATGKHALKVQQLNDQIIALRSEANSTRAMLENTQVALATEQQAHAKTSSELNDAVLKQAKLTQEVSDLRERQVREEQHRQSLEDKHKQVRESLEHFRQSSKEQREQEHRKHDQDIQYLQSELRNVNQALTVKQQETTQAHQECTRLLGELAHAQAGLHSAQEETRTLKQQNANLAHAQKQADDFGKQLVQMRAAFKLLEESKTEMQLQVDGLVSDKQRLEMELVAARATLEAQKVLTDAILQRFNANDSVISPQDLTPQMQLPLVEAATKKAGKSI